VFLRKIGGLWRFLNQNKMKIAFRPKPSRFLANAMAARLEGVA